MKSHLARVRGIPLPRVGRRLWTALGLLLIGVPLGGCGAVYPELHPPLSKPPAGRPLEPPPPRNLLFITFKSAVVPPTTRGGRPWDTTGGEKPDPYGVLKINGQEVIRTPVQPNTLHPTWPEQQKANYRVPSRARATVELWDDDPITDHPICVTDIPDVQDDASNGQVQLLCDSGARVTLRIEPAHARVGLGFYYELRTVGIFITRVAKESPAGRVGLKSGDQILRIQGKEVRQMQEGEARSLINANAGVGVMLTVKHANGNIEDMTLKNGPIYPVLSDGIPLG